jgi:predicted O-methyltransferase YrrM
VDVQSFASALPGLFGGDLAAERPLDGRFRQLMDDVPGMSSENKLALLNLAGSLLPPGEAYLEVGSWKGLSIIAAALGNDSSHFYAIESFRGFGVDRLESRNELQTNLERWNVSDRVSLIVDNAFRSLRRRDSIMQPIGVFFYDGSHDRLAHYLALGMAEPVLADEALVIIDDSSRPVVGRTTDLYVRTHPGYTLLFDLDARHEADPRWWNGIRVYAFRRSGQRTSREPFELRWRRLLYLRTYEPTTWAVARAANVTLRRHPALMRMALAVAHRMQPKVKPRDPA